MNPFFQQFVRQVYRMRRAQKMATKNKTRSMLAEAERIEQAVDKMLEEMGYQAAKLRQLGFEDPEPHRTDDTQGEYHTS